MIPACLPLSGPSSVFTARTWLLLASSRACYVGAANCLPDLLHVRVRLTILLMTVPQFCAHSKILFWQLHQPPSHAAHAAFTCVPGYVAASDLTFFYSAPAQQATTVLRLLRPLDHAIRLFCRSPCVFSLPALQHRAPQHLPGSDWWAGPLLSCCIHGMHLRPPHSPLWLAAPHLPLAVGTDTCRSPALSAAVVACHSLFTGLVSFVLFSSSVSLL